MKKLAAFAVLAAVLAVSVTAFADESVEYTGGTENTAIVTGVNGYSIEEMLRFWNNDKIFVSQKGELKVSTAYADNLKLTKSFCLN